MKNRLSNQTVWGCMLVLYNVFSCFSELLHSQGQTHVKSTHDANNAMQCNFLRHYWWNARHLKRESIIWAQNSAGCVDFYIFSSFFFCSREHFRVDWPCTTTWLLGTRICWPSGVCAYWRTVVLCWAPPVVTVCRPWRPSDPGVASWIVPLAEIVTKMRKIKHSISMINDIINNAIMTPVITKCKTYIGHSLLISVISSVGK